MPDPRPPRRRTQEERREATRAALLSAAIDCLAEEGFAATTTGAVCARAGVSQGALFNHFPTKGDLLASAAEHLFAHLVDEFRAGLARFAGVQDRAEAAVRRLWEIFQQPRLHAAFELYNAARTDRELAERLAPVARRHGENLHRLARELFPATAAARPEFDAVVSLVVMALQGAALGSLADREAGHREAEPLLLLLTDLVRKIVA
jgi:AcrR family transcriptional regulator